MRTVDSIANSYGQHQGPHVRGPQRRSAARVEVGSPPGVVVSPEIERLKAWLPIDAIVRNGRPAIQWMDMSGVVLEEPFFHQTVDRIRNTRAGAEEVITDLDALIRLEKIADSLTPSGFIFHSSRCGSTLVANACKSLKDSLVIAEAFVVDKLISRFFTDTDADGTKDLIYSLFLRAAISALGQRRFGNERHYFVKFACISILQFARIRRIWPSVPAVFLYRDPIEVMVSNMRSVPEWMMIETNPATAAAIIGVSQSDLVQMSREEFCARALGRYYSAAEAIGDERTLVVNYNELTAQVLLRLVKFFGVVPTAEETEAIAQTARLYSKDPALRSIFTGDSDSKRANASMHVREMADKWALPSYQRLTVLQRHRIARLPS